MTIVKPNGKPFFSAKSDDDKEAIRAAVTAGMSPADVCDKYNVSRASIMSMIGGRQHGKKKPRIHGKNLPLQVGDRLVRRNDERSPCHEHDRTVKIVALYDGAVKVRTSRGTDRLVMVSTIRGNYDRLADVVAAREAEISLPFTGPPSQLDRIESMLNRLLGMWK
jgi:hypothetical protein